MKTPLDLSKLLKPVQRFFQRFHLTVFIVIIVGGLAYAVVSLYDVLSEASTVPSDSTTPQSSSVSFDQTTIDRLGQMYTVENAPSSTPLPEGRINPFGE